MESFIIDYFNDVYVCSKLGVLYLEVGEIEKVMELLFWGL